MGCVDIMERCRIKRFFFGMMDWGLKVIMMVYWISTLDRIMRCLLGSFKLGSLGC
jgi:hypothetical protein